ncbi:outer membrane beta-barrel protein [Pseudoalteromonas denitrificans]|uniref:Outer membrane protein beta-barrel domain-containing protein n=1 Tax=Pseudoalteromonas denitrificans DSM 6059 TaxID=1123010 RepID=A0A1I1PYS8_9GAMM|nr:outer membrane beta-barrel protein [Pseudoalteromonas denitrificans]SFD14832.1 Outer membrane protein beta-barrel domain-containing protein [Pseudoalteromonas denitrificans DSM 6059]
MKARIILPSLFATVLSISSYAQNDASSTEPSKKHTFGAQWSLGSVDYDKAHFDDDGVVQIYGYYNYRINNRFAVEVGINRGADWDWDCDNDDNDDDDDDDDDWGCDSTWFWSDDEIEFTNYVVAAKGNVELSQRNSLFAKFGAQFYDYELSYKNVLKDDDNGVGVFAEAGWQYRWDFGLGLNAGIQFIDMGDLDTTTFTTGMSYQF